MCLDCYKEAGSPKIINDKTIKVAKLVTYLYDLEDCGGACHIVVDDWNLENEHIEFCLEYLEKGKEKYSELSYNTQTQLLNLMSELTLDERYSAMAINYGVLEIKQ